MSFDKWEHHSIAGRLFLEIVAVRENVRIKDDHFGEYTEMVPMSLSSRDVWIKNALRLRSIQPVLSHSSQDVWIKI